MQNMRNACMTCLMHAEPMHAYQDFKARTEQYEKVYETLDLSNPNDNKYSFVKLVNAGQSMVTNRIVGALPRKVMGFSANLTPFARHVYITAHGDTAESRAGVLGIDARLAPEGKIFSQKLKQWADALGHRTMHVWCAPTQAGMRTAAPLGRDQGRYHVQLWRALQDRDYGDFKGKTYAEIKEQHPKAWEKLKQDEYFYQWPRGESLAQVVERLDPVLRAMEGKTAPILIICSRTVCRALLSYCRDLLPEQFIRIRLPPYTVFDIDMNPEPVKVTSHELWAPEPGASQPQAGSTRVTLPSE